MQYKAIYRAYSHAIVAKKFRTSDDSEADETTAEVKSVKEARDWSDYLNESAKEGFRIREGGALQLSDNLVFWAFLEKP